MARQSDNRAGAGGKRRTRPGRLAGLVLALALLAGAGAAAQQPSLNGDPSQLESADGLSPIEARNALSRAGYLPNLTGFQNAVEAGDAAAIPLYQAAGLELTGDTVRGYVNPMYGNLDTFDPEVAMLLAEGGVDRRDFCLDPSGTWDQYFLTARELAHEAERVAFLRRLCGRDDTVLAIRALLHAEELELAALSLDNEARPGRIAACVEAYAADHPVNETIAEAEGFSLFDIERISPPHDTVMMELSSWHLAGRQAAPEDAYAEAVKNGCGAASPAHVINTAHRDRLIAVLAILRPGETPSGTGATLSEGG